MISITMDGVTLDIEYDYTPEIPGGRDEEPVPEWLCITSIKLQDSNVELKDFIEDNATDLSDKIFYETLRAIKDPDV